VDRLAREYQAAFSRLESLARPVVSRG